MTSERISYKAAEERWKKADREMKERHSHEYWLMFRHTLLPRKVSFRAENMVKGIISKVYLLRSLERTRASAPEWIRTDSNIAFTRKQLRVQLRALRRYIRSRYGMLEEFAPLFRSFMQGWTDNVDFEKDITWALRLLERDADSREILEERRGIAPAPDAAE